MSNPSYQKPRGFEDILPDDVGVWQEIESTVHDLYPKFGYREIRVPHIEHTELFVRSIGEATDIVEKEMFTFKKGDEQSLSLRPEITASLCRSVIENHLRKQEPFQKLYYVGPCFRYEKPQKGRLRQFHQIGVEAIGADDPLLDLETIDLFVRTLHRTGVSNFTVHLNTMGCQDCRPVYRDHLKDHIEPRLDGLCENCQDRFHRNLFRVLDCKRESCQSTLGDVPPIYEDLCAPCSDHWSAVRNRAKDLRVDVKEDPRLVRGLDYYTRTVYEMRSGDLGAQNALGGGGRYNGLMEELGGEPAGGIGFGIGVERLILARNEQEDADPETDNPLLYLVSVDEECHEEAYSLASHLRRKDFAVDLNYEDRSLKSQMRVANRSGAPLVGILGPDEIEQDEITIKTMSSGEEKRVRRDNLEDHLSSVARS